MKEPNTNGDGKSLAFSFELLQYIVLKGVRVSNTRLAFYYFKTYLITFFSPLGPDSVRDLTVLKTYSDAFSVTWKPPLKPGGTLQGYKCQ